MEGRYGDEESSLELQKDQEEGEEIVARRPTSQSPSAIAKRKRYAEAKAAKLAQVQSDPAAAIDPPVIDQDLQVEVAPNEAPKLSLKDRLFGGNTPPLAGAPTKAKTVKKGQRGKAIDASLLAKTFPSMVAGLTASYSQRLIHDPYKPCAPNQQEVYCVISPLFSILSRRIEIVGTASEDIIDIISAVIAGFTAGIRIHITYLSISEAVQKAKLNGHATNGSNAIPNPGPGPTDGYRGTAYDFSTGQTHPISSGLPSESANVEYDAANSENGDNGNAKPEAELFANLAKRDRTGRVRLGLIPG